MAIGDQSNQLPLISVPEGLKIAVDAGVQVSMPTVRAFFKNSKSMTRFGHKIYRRRDEFLQTLNGMGHNDNQGEEQGGTGGGDSGSTEKQGTDA